jgi:SAM-dependent methyltransferase
MKKLIDELKKENQDYEFYPTTKEICFKVSQDIKSNTDGYSSRNIDILDIGCGNGNALKLIQDCIWNKNDKYGNPENSNVYFKFFGIEKSEILIKNIKKDVVKKVSVIGSFIFNDSEYRKANAKVDIVKIDFEKFSNKTAFDSWFDKNFNFETEEPKKETEEKAKKHNELVDGQNLIERLIDLYNNEMDGLLNNYKSLQNISGSLLQELGIKKDTLKSGLETKISGLKNKYWQELFNNLDKIKKRLTTKYRKKLLDKITGVVSVDFNLENVYSVVIWVVKNSNSYQDDQLKDLYFRMTEPKNIKLYKSNKHFVVDEWRYNFRRDVSKYALDYRIVVPCAVASSWDFENKNGLSKGAYEFIFDIFSIACNFGYSFDDNIFESHQWEIGKAQKFNDINGELFGEFKFYKNGNVHAKLSKNFMLKFNLEAGKLNGWLKSPEQAAEEMEVKIKDVEKFFKSHTKIELNNFKRLL